ncbi:MAG: UDP-N-acetylmuramate--L-alanine ligase [Pseudomonadota bacterium]
MRVSPLSLGPLHFVGIGGIGMSGIAEILNNLGYTVQGSDLSESHNVRRLRGLGIDVKVGHALENLGEAEVVVISSAVTPENPEVAEARARRIPVVRRAEMLGELMRLKWSIAVAGTHGKTTTTSMVAAMLDAAKLDPTVINGGIINAYGTNAHLGEGDWMVVEADESDGSFLRLPAMIGVITNIDPEHMEFYGDFDAVRQAYHNFVERLPFYGFAVMCVDHPEVQALLGRIVDRRVVTYGFSPQADIRALDPKIDANGETFDVVIRDRKGDGETRLSSVRLSMQGLHNVQNALAAIAIARELDLGVSVIRSALSHMAGVKRRFTHTGTIDGITIIDDYAHHPVEIRAVLRTARAAGENRVIAVMQPHRYSRLQALFDEFCTCFGNADIVAVAPVFAAGEEPVEGFDQAALTDGLRAHGQREVVTIEGMDELAELIDRVGLPGDIVICLGAGSITQWANALPEALAERRQPRKAS